MAMLSEFVTVALALVVVLVVAALSLRFLRGPNATSRRMQIVERLPLDAKNALVIVKMSDLGGAEALLIGVGGDGAPRVLSRIEKLTPEEPQTAPSFRDWLTRLRPQKPASAPDDSEKAQS